MLLNDALSLGSTRANPVLLNACFMEGGDTQKLEEGRRRYWWSLVFPDTHMSHAVQLNSLK